MPLYDDLISRFQKMPQRPDVVMGNEVNRIPELLYDYIKQNALLGAFNDQPKPQLTQEEMQEEVALRALDAVTPFPIAGITIGRKGLENLGVNAEKDLVGQYSGLWDRGVRAELDDTATKLLPNRLQEWSSPDGSYSYKHSTVGDYLAGTQVPYLQDTPIRFDEMSSLGHYSADNGIQVNKGVLQDSDIKNTTLHELQHAIQEREGFARGGSPEAMQIGRDFSVDEFKNRWGQLVDSGVPVLEAREIANEEFVMNSYRRLAGEWEARNAGTRAVLPSDDPRLGNALDFNGVRFRTGSPFSTADDIALQDFIIRMNN